MQEDKSPEESFKCNKQSAPVSCCSVRILAQAGDEPVAPNRALAMTTGKADTQEAGKCPPSSIGWRLPVLPAATWCIQKTTATSSPGSPAALPDAAKHMGCAQV